MMTVPSAPSPDRFICGWPMWEGPGWTVCAGSRAFAIRLEADANLEDPFTECGVAAIHRTVTDAGSDYRQIVKGLFYAPTRQDCWALLAYWREIIANERGWTAREVAAPHSTVPQDRETFSAEALFEVVRHDRVHP